MRFNGVQKGSGKRVVSISAPDEQESRPIQGKTLRPLTASGETLLILCASPLQLSREGKHTIKITLGDNDSGESVNFQDYFNVVKTAK
jgi:hypothetical protein